MNKQNRNFIGSAAFLIVAAAFTRVFPHYPNFTAIGAMAIFGGTVIKDKKLAFLLPLSALFLSDVALQLFTATKGFYGVSQYFVYIAFIVVTALATFIKKPSASNIVFAAVWSGVIFFIISNFGTWAEGIYYPKTLVGLGACYMAAIPFYKNELFGNFALNLILANLFYSAILFIAYSWISRRQMVSRVVA